MVKFELERGQEVARHREVAYKEGVCRRDYCTAINTAIAAEQIGGKCK